MQRDWKVASAGALVIRDLRVVADLRASLLVSDRLATVGGLAASIVEEIREPTYEMRSQLEGMRMQLECLAEVVDGASRRKNSPSWSPSERS